MLVVSVWVVCIWIRLRVKVRMLYSWGFGFSLVTLSFFSSMRNINIYMCVFGLDSGLRLELRCIVKVSVWVRLVYYMD